MKKWILACLVGVVIVLPNVSAATVDRYVSSFTVSTGEVLSGDVSSLKTSDNESLILSEDVVSIGIGSVQVLPDHDDIYGSDFTVVGDCGPGTKYRCVDEFFGADDDTGSMLSGHVDIAGTYVQSIGMRDTQCVVGTCTAHTVFLTVTWQASTISAIATGWTFYGLLGYDTDTPSASFFCAGFDPITLWLIPRYVWQYTIIDNVTDSYGSSDCADGLFDDTARWYLNLFVACSVNCGSAAGSSVLVTQASMGANMTSTQSAFDAEFTIPMSPNDPPGNLTWECDSDTGTYYDIGIIRASDVRWLGDVCDGTGTYIEVLSGTDVVSSILTVRITDNSTITASPNAMELDVLKASTISPPWIVSNENLGWLIYLILISMGVLLSCYAVYRWRNGE